MASSPRPTSPSDAATQEPHFEKPQSRAASPSDTGTQEPEVEKQDSNKDVNGLDKAPDGGLQAWLVAAGGFSIAFCCLGFVNSFGTFEEYYLANQLKDYTPDDVAWIGSTTAFLQFFVGLFAGPLFDRYGAWVSNHRLSLLGVDTSLNDH
jgi:hypothetical protein